MTARPDFPYYNGLPVPIQGSGWLLLMLSLVVGFAALVTLPLHDFPLNFIPALIFVGLPLLALRQVVGGHWRALFRPVGVWQVGAMVLFAALTILGSMAVGLILTQFFTMTANPLNTTLKALSAVQIAGVLLPTIPQLIGEELLGILPFLAALWFCTKHLRLSRGAGIFVGLIVSALIFGAVHLPTYDWNFAQALLGIGAARIFLTLAYIVTRNLWVSAGAHILNDWTEFGFVVVGAHLQPETAALLTNW